MKQLPPVQSLSAFVKLGMDELEIEQIIEFLEQSRTEIEAAEAILAAIQARYRDTATAYYFRDLEF